ncbi:MAG: TetR/AcrR family transcriptional regulator [Acidimicrobiales bacterium]
MAEMQERRGRPRSFEHDSLLERSIDVFWRHGLAGTTTRVLETELAISQSSLYNTYGSKDGLLDQAVERYEARLDATVLSRLDDASRDGLIDFVGAVVRWISRKGQRGCLILNLAAEDKSQHHRLKAYRSKLRRAIKPAVRSFTDEEDLVTGRTELLVASVLGLNMCARSGAGNAELNRIGNGIKRQIADW